MPVVRDLLLLALDDKAAATIAFPELAPTRLPDGVTA
jgi:hypothetical protein